MKVALSNMNWTASVYNAKTSENTFLAGAQKIAKFVAIPFLAIAEFFIKAVLFVPVNGLMMLRNAFFAQKDVEDKKNETQTPSTPPVDKAEAPVAPATPAPVASSTPAPETKEEEKAPAASLTTAPETKEEEKAPAASLTTAPAAEQEEEKAPAASLTTAPAAEQEEEKAPVDSSQTVGWRRAALVSAVVALSGGALALVGLGGGTRAVGLDGGTLAVGWLDGGTLANVSMR